MGDNADGSKTTRIVAVDAAGVAEAAGVLAAGGLAALPTETVYGLAARADDPAAVARIFAAKGRPSFNPLIVHVASLAAAQALAAFSPEARLLAQAFWPGPLTLVLPRRGDAALAGAVSAGLPTIALRMPQHPAMRAVLEACPFPLAAPSANRSGFISPTTAAHVLATLDGLVDLVMDGGATGQGIESTIVAVREDGTLDELRPGPLTVADMAAKLRGATSVRPMNDKAEAPIEAPGQSSRHYAPGKPMRLDVVHATPDEFLIGFGTVTGDTNLSPSGDLAEAASRLYACLHAAAASENPRIAVAPIPQSGVGRAINDRLRRAAAD